MQTHFVKTIHLLQKKSQLREAREKSQKNTVWVRIIFSLSVCLFLSVQSIDVTLCTMTRNKVDQQRSRVANSGISTSNLSFHRTWAESVSCIDLPQTSKIRLKVRHGEAAHIHRQSTHTNKAPVNITCPPTQRTCTEIKIFKYVCVPDTGVHLFLCTQFLQQQKTQKTYTTIYKDMISFSHTPHVSHTFTHKTGSDYGKIVPCNLALFCIVSGNDLCVIAITAATRGFVCVGVCECVCNDIRRAFDTLP